MAGAVGGPVEGAAVDAVGERTLADLLRERVERDPGKTWLVFEDRAGTVSEYTYAEFADRVARVAAGLRGLGVGPGDRVLVHLRNSPEFLLSWFAAAWIGAVMVPSNTANTAAEVTYLVQRARVAVAVGEAESVELFARVRAAAPVLRTVLVTRVGSAPEGTARFDDLLGSEPAGADAARAASSDVCQILFTSGTTAKPKGVMVTHANALWSGLRMSTAQGLEPTDRCLTALPLFHVNGQSVTVLAALTAGATVVLLERFEAERYLDQVRAHRATQTSVVAAVAKALLGTPARADDAAHGLRRFAYSINIADHEKEELEKRFGVALLNIYGLSEACETVTMSPLHGPQRWPSVGLPPQDRRVRVVTDDGRPAEVGERGEIQVHGVPGRTVMAGYFEDPEETARVLSADGWVRTGDLGHLDAAGYLYFADRRKNVIKTSGQNVSTTEVELLLAEHDGVAEAAVIGIPHARRGEVAKAYVVRAAGSAVGADELVAFCAERLANYKVPAEVEFLAELPRTSVGKLAKGELSARHRAGES